MGNWTTIPVKKETRDRLEEHGEKDGRDWDTFLRREVLGEDIDGDAVKDMDQIERELDARIDFPTADVKEAVRQVLREELPEGALRA